MTLASAIASVLAEALRRRPLASLVVSGGSTPRDMYAQLAQHPLDWSRLLVTLADERWVATDEPDSTTAPAQTALARAR